MTSAILMVAILGQCSGGRCPAPARIAAPIYRPAPVVVRTPTPDMSYVLPGDERPLVRRWVTVDGLHFEVYGIEHSNGTRIRWEPTLDFNRESWAAAKAKAARPRSVPSAGVGRQAEAPKREIQNFGIAPDKMGRHADSYTAQSPEAQRFVQEAHGTAGEPGSLHVTVIGSVDDCAPVVNDLKNHPALAGVRDRLMVQDYRPGEWAVSPSLGFQGQGRPTILIQTARSTNDPQGGRVVYRAMSYEGGPERLAEAIRKADPHYNPSLDPGPGKPGPSGCPLGFTSDHWGLIIVVGAVLVVVLIAKPKVKS